MILHTNFIHPKLNSVILIQGRLRKQQMIDYVMVIHKNVPEKITHVTLRRRMSQIKKSVTQATVKHTKDLMNMKVIAQII